MESFKTSTFGTSSRQTYENFFLSKFLGKVEKQEPRTKMSEGSEEVQATVPRGFIVIIVASVKITFSKLAADAKLWF